MDRETKGTMQRQGQVEANGSSSPLGSPTGAVAPSRRAPSHRTTPLQFFREIRDELRQVAWPSKVEVVNYSAVVFVTLVLMVALIFALNFVFGKGILFMFQK
ncbi:MAG: preprotein translocase subunit SecE [Acidimicrobiales bacterium]